LPGFLGKAPEKVVEPSPSQMMDNFERVLRYEERNEREVKSQNGIYPKSTQGARPTRGMGAVSEFADGVKSTRRPHRAELDA
jgi:hypothetical protein